MSEGKQRIILTDKKILETDGVRGVISFDESYLELETDLGTLTVIGEGMKVEALNNDTGKVLVKGNITELGYKEKRTKKKIFGL